MGNTTSCVIYPREDCRPAAEEGKPVLGAMCMLKGSGATCTVSVFDLGHQAEGALRGAVAPHDICLAAGECEMLPVLAGRTSVSEKRVPRNLAVS